MSRKYNRRKFIKLSTAAVAGGVGALSGINYSCSSITSRSEVIVWDGPGKDVLESPDYEVTLKRDGNIWKSFTYYSYNKSVDKFIDDKEGKYIKLSFLGLHSKEYISPENDRDTFAHSWTYFDFAGGPVDVEVKVLKPFYGLTLPLKSCGVFPSSLAIESHIIGENIIRFSLAKPAKIAVVPNHLEALEKLKNVELKQTFEGYRNPLFLFARAPETNVPSKTAQGTLVVKPGQSYGVDDFTNAGTIYFEAGVHDYSQYNPDDHYHYIQLKTGQMVYLAGGAYVYGVFCSDIKGPISKMPVIRGRGTFSGDKQLWTGTPNIQTLERNVCLEGIHITDPHNHISHSISPVKDVAVVGAWHGNTDGIGRDVLIADPYTGWHCDDCFVMAADTNLAAGGSGRIRNHTIWQLNNAEPLWLRRVNGSIVDGMEIIAFNKWGVSGPNPGQVVNFFADERRGPNKDLVLRNVRIEAPFIPRLFLLSSDYKGEKQAYDNVLFENIIVNTPYIHFKSPIGLLNVNSSSFGKVVFRNLVVNGTKVTSGNYNDYFELLAGVSVGKEVVFE
jgi:hypothetical protein